jgi:hypothetical protein
MTRITSTEPPATSRRWPKLVAALGVAVLVALGIALPATSASALAIDCSYTTGLGGADGWAAGHDVGCLAGGSVPGSLPGATKGLPGSGVAAGVMDTGCRYFAPAMPAELFSKGAVTVEQGSFPDIGGDRGRVDVTSYFRDGKFFAERQVYDGSGDNEGSNTIIVRDYTDFPLVIQNEFDCYHDETFQTSFYSADGDFTDGDLAPGTTPPTPVPTGSVDPTTATLTPLPVTNEFLYRVDVKNTHSTTSPIVLNFDLSDFSVVSILSMPSADTGASCPPMALQSLMCVIHGLGAGETGSFLFHVKARPTTAVTADLRAYASLIGFGSTRDPRPTAASGTWVRTTTAAVTPTDGIMDVTSFITPERAAVGHAVTYGLTMRATAAGSPEVSLDISGLGSAAEASLPSGWTRDGALNGDTITYHGASMNAGDITSLSLHFTISGDSDDVSVRSHVNGAIREDSIVLRPDAPVCTGTATVLAGGHATTLGGVTCHGAAGTTLATDGVNAAAHGDVAVSATSTLQYTAKDAAFTGSDTVYVYVTDAAGRPSEVTAIPVTVVALPTATADEFRVVGGTLNADVSLNDVFPADRDGWSIDAGSGPSHGTVALNANGTFTYRATAGYTGDDSFRYRLGGPDGAHSDAVTVTLHVS